MTVLITGAAGGVGQLLVPQLAAEQKLRLTDLATIPEVHGAQVVTGDLTDRAFAADVTSDVDAVVHLAANPDPGGPWPARTSKR
jgi:nucleoside-diphosphate-sugar epimerase